MLHDCTLDISDIQESPRIAKNATMATRSTQEKASIPSDIASGHGVTPYERELKDTFRLYDTEKTGKLSMRKLHLAMRTLGFEASIDDVQEIVDKTPSLGLHQRKNRQHRHQHPYSSNSRNNGQATGKDTNSPPQATLIASGARRSSRAATVASRSGSTSKYVDPDDDDFESVDKDDLGQDPGNEDDDEGFQDSYDEPLFTLDDFITMMTPNEVCKSALLDVAFPLLLQAQADRHSLPLS